MTQRAAAAAGDGPAVPRQRSRTARALATAALLAALAGFTALGLWQVERRAWKLDLIERTAARLAAPAQALPAASGWAALDTPADEFRRVSLEGRWIDGADTLVQASTKLGPGWWLLTPLRTADGGTVLVNRGYVPNAWRERPWPAAASASTVSAPATSAAVAPVRVVGLLRHSEPGGGFLRANDPAIGRWTSRDVAAIAAARGLGTVAPFFVDAEALPGAEVGEQPVGGLTVTQFRNNHAVYAFTWFGLALMSAVAIAFLWKEHRRPTTP